MGNLKISNSHGEKGSSSEAPCGNSSRKPSCRVPLYGMPCPMWLGLHCHLTKVRTPAPWLGASRQGPRRAIGDLNYIKNCLYIYYVLSRVEGSAAFHSNSPITFNAARLILESASLRTLRRHHHVVSGTPSLLHRLRYAISRHAISRVQVPRRSAIARQHPLDAIPSRSSSPSDYIDCGPSHP